MSAARLPRLTLLATSCCFVIATLGCGGKSTQPTQLAAPLFSPAPGTYTSTQTVAISDGAAGAAVYYTLDGSVPSASSSRYGSPIAIASSTTLSAIAIEAGSTNSAVTTGTYAIATGPLPAATPTFAPAGGTYTSAQTVTLADSTPGATIYYTADGSTPTTFSPQYTAPIAVPRTTTLHAIAIASGKVTSAVGTATYTINIPPPVAPTISPAGGVYTAAQTVTLSDATPFATIYYTTDGSAPTTASPQYTAPFSVDAPGATVVQAAAALPNSTTSAETSATFTLNFAASYQPTYSWRNVTIVGGGFVDGLFFHPRSQGLMYARTDVGGAYRWNNTTGGDTAWTPLLDFVGRFDSGYNLGVESLALDPNDPTRLYLAVGEYTESYGTNGYILASSNMGNSFSEVPLPFHNGSNDNGRFAGERLSVDPANGKHLYFGTNQNGLYESTDQAASFHAVTAFPVTGPTGSPADPGAGVIFEDYLPTSGTTTNAGSTTTKTVYVGVSDPATGLYVSNDGGATFSAVAGQPTGYYPDAGVFDPSNRYLYISYARQSVYSNGVSSPCASSCTSVGPGGVNDGQIWRYTLPTSQTLAGSWTNITPPLLAGESTAQFLNNPYGYSGVTIDPSHPDTVMVTTLNKYYPPPFDDVFRSLDDGATWVDYGAKINRNSSLSPWINFGQATPDGGNWLNHLVVDPFNSDHMMYGDGQTIWQTTDATAVDGTATSTAHTTAGNATDWSIGAPGLEETVVLGLASPPSGPAHLFSAMYDLGGFTHTTLASALDAQENPQLTNGAAVDFAGQAPLNVARVGDNTDAQGSGTAVQREAFSSDGGLTWTPSASLPRNPTTGAAITQGDGTIAVAADGSNLVWAPVDPGTPANYSTDHGATWHTATGAPAQINQGYNRTVVAADRVNPKKFYLFSPQSPTSNDGTTSIYISTDGGMTFTLASQLANQYDTGFVVSPAAEGDLWTTSYNGLNHSVDSGATFTSVLPYGNTSYALGFGAADPQQSYPALYMIGQLGSDGSCASPSDVTDGFTVATNCIYRSVDEGKTFVRINDFAHQYSNATILTGDPRVFGRFYLGTPGRGIIEGDSPN